MKIGAWIQAFRLRTLPLALASILMGIASAGMLGYKNFQVSIWAIITTLLLQILSNLANDYGDGIKGTDNKDRIGPTRSIQSGRITQSQMKNALAIFIILSLISGLVLIYQSRLTLETSLGFLVLGIASIVAAILYTIGKKAYGYNGLGDVFVFIFFGLVAVLGSFYLITHFYHWSLILPASTVGFLSTAVLNLNNMRDFENDKKVGKNTLVVKMGVKNAKLYHTILVNMAFFSLLAFFSLNSVMWQYYICFGFYPLFLIDLIAIDKEKELKNLDPFLKKTALKTFFFVLLFTVLTQFLN